MKYIFIILVVVIICIIIIVHNSMHKNVYTTSARINKLLEYFCTDPPVFNPNNYGWTENFRNNWKHILDEYLNYTRQYSVPLHRDLNKEVASCDINTGWRTLYLRAFGIDTNIANYFPITMYLISKCPCTLAFFSVLKPGAKLAPHVGLYKGVLRYHLGLIVPTDYERCFIDVNGHRLHWIQGSDIMFDDMFTHYVENNTSEMRVVLFLDIKRDFKNPVINLVNTFFLKFVKSNDALTSTIDNVNYYAVK